MPNLLPRLIDNHNVLPATPGKFLDVPADTLIAISDGLETSPAALQINSIPDVWARLLLFEAALFDANHRLHNIVLGEWRGLLALLALKEIKNVRQLTVQAVSLTENPAENNQIWHSSLKNLIPATQIYQNTTWENLFLFLVDGRPVGITSPTTLVATATHYPTLTLPRAQVSWYDGTQLQDPVQNIIQPQNVAQNALSTIDREGLAAWLNHLHTQLQPKQVLDSGRAQQLLGLIKSFRDDLNRNPQAFEPAQFGLGISGVNAGIFVLLDKPVKPLRVPPTSSNVMLRPSAGRTPSKPMLLVDKKIAEKWQVRPSEVLVHNTLTLASIPYEGLLPNQHDRIGSTEIDDAEIWRPQDLLTDKIYYVQAQGSFPGTINENWYGNPPKINNQGISIILPVDKVLLGHLTPADILENLIFTQNNTGDITVKLTVRLSGIDNHNSYEIEKTYSRDLLVPLDQVPILEVFPNFNSPNWDAYYVAYSADNLNNIFQVKPYPENAQPVTLDIPGNQGGSRKVWKLDQFPEAFVCALRQRNTQDTEEIGLLLLSTPEPIPAANRMFTVGVDFGASGTMVYYSDNNQKIPLVFENRKLTVTNVSSAQKADVLKFFLPEEDITPSFLTLYQDFNNTNQEPQTMLNGHIYYLLGAAHDLSDANIYTNLKWSAIADTNFRVKSFLAQICLQSAAELAARGASSIDWRFSYPTAFSETQTANFGQYWQQIIAGITELTGINSGPPAYLSESIASAECFRNGGASANNQGASTATGAIFVDIGGSTSDVSVWQQDSLRLQLSLRFAGRDIFHNYLLRHLEVLEIFKVNTDSLRQISSNKEKFWSQMDSVLRQNSRQIFADLPAYFEDRRLLPLKQYLAVGLAGLFFYLGLSVKHLIETGNYSPAMPHIYFGGNGSQMFRWLCSGANITNSHAMVRLFEKVFSTAVNHPLNGVFNLTMSERLKHESAYGLVCSPRLNAVNGQNTIIAGESFVQNSVNFEWNTDLNNQIPDAPLRPPANFTQLTAFVNSFNEFARTSQGMVNPIDFSAAVSDSVNRYVDNHLSDPSEQKVVFILALRGLLETLN